ncbi:SxtJ family membrane protein [Sediminibacter sp. Hel_I_10]|uniref:SxtJ family membrane protein n=1 Tax=Sediminibacter sp. Hel_I_10 TaxID=1392490 RepID=UPI00047B5486|nr:SxtJ family membrane protein [Sediminibacter sp. Hel_I_10]
MKIWQHITKQQCAETAVVLAVVLIFIGYNLDDWRYVLSAGIILVLSLVMPIVFYPLAKLWFALGVLLSMVSTKILLTVLFFLILTPMALFRKWIGKDSLMLKRFKKETDSVLITRDHTFSTEDLKHPY